MSASTTQEKTEATAADQRPPLISVDGVLFPNFFETNRPMKEHIECIKELEMRDDDVILCALPKAGTHWLWEVTSMLLAGKTEYEKRAKEFAMLEASEIETTQQMASPRVLNTHVPVSMLPRQVKDKKPKVIHVYRNVKDLTVSLYFHLKQNPGTETLTVEQMMDDVLLGEANRNGNYIAYLKTMDAFIKENPDIPIFNVSFEETKKDPVGTVTRLAEFLGVAHTPELCQQVADACSFHKMKAANEAKQQPGHLPPVQMYRKGEVGDWKNHLTVAQNERLEAAMKSLEGCDFTFQYTL